MPVLAVRADVTLDGTLGPAGPLTGPDFRIPAEIGRQVGGNLFHSFGRFGLVGGESATFSGPASVANVIGRVTGGEASNIDGTIRSTIPGANLYLTNPAGMVFGPNARLDVDGSFYASTAHHLKLEDGGRFDAVTPGSSSLSAAPVAAFGFLDAPPAPLTVDRTRLQVPQGERIAVVGGDVRISNGTLYAPGGRIDVAAARPAGEVAAGENGLEVSGTGAGGQVEIVHTTEPRPEVSGHALGNLDASGETGGSVYIRGGRILVQGGVVFADTWGAGDAGGVDLGARQEIRIEDGAVLTSDTLGTGDAGRVTLAAGRLVEVANGGQVSSSTYGRGDGGAVGVEAGQLVVDRQGSEGFTLIGSSAEGGSSGDAGAVDITVKDAVELVDGGQIVSGTRAQGNAGTVTVETDRLLIDGQRPDWFTGIASSAEPGSSGNAGDVRVSVAGSMELLTLGTLSTSTYGRGDAGSLTVEAGRLFVGGVGLFSAAAIASTAESGSSGRAGDVRVSVTGEMELVTGGRVGSSTFGQGDAGTVSVEAGRLLVEGQGLFSTAGIASVAESGALGRAGDVNVTVEDSLALVAGGRIASSTFGQGNGGSVTVKTGQLRVEGQGLITPAEITSDAEPGSSGNAGDVHVSVTGSMELVDGGRVSSGTSAQGDAGTVTVKAGRLLIDRQGSETTTGIFSSAESGSSGNAGTIAVAVDDDTVIVNGGQIISSTFAQGDAGTVTVESGKLRLDDQGSVEATLITSSAESGSSGNAGTVDVTVEDAIELVNGAQILSLTFAQGDAGTVTVKAGRLLIDRQGSESATGIFSSAETGSSGNAGTVAVAVEHAAAILNGGQINSSTFAQGDAGAVTVEAGELRLDDQGAEATTLITSSAEAGSSGNAGTVDIAVRDLLEIVNGAQIVSLTFAQGNADAVTVEAGSLLIDRQGSESATGVFSTAEPGSSGNAGTVAVTVEDAAAIVNGGHISSSTFAQGDAGAVTVEAGELRLDDQGAEATTLITSSAEAGSSGNAGTVDITVRDLLEIVNGAQILSLTFAQGDADAVTVEAGSLLIDRQGSESATGVFSTAEPGSSGNGGTVAVTVDDAAAIVNGGHVSSSTYAQGDAGAVTVEADRLLIDRQGAGAFTGIASQANADSSGDAGIVNVTINDTLELLNGGQIASSTFAQGDAGTVIVEADRLIIDGRNSELLTGVMSRAELLAAGNVGNVTVKVRDLHVTNGGTISIESLAIFAEEDTDPGNRAEIRIFADSARITNGASVNAESLGTVPASNISVKVSDRLVVDNALISTVAFLGDGGAIEVDGNILALRDGQITTSVTSDAPGLTAGNIRLSPEFLVLDTGFIQANSNSPGGSGGDIRIDAAHLLASGAQLLVGGEERRTFHRGVAGGNVIQAVAPEGVSGDITLSASPELDISGSLITLPGNFLDASGELSQSCDASGAGRRSSLLVKGRGTLPQPPEIGRPGVIRR